MPIEQLNGFSQILSTFNFQQEEAPFKENANNPELLSAQEDSIQLSIQAQKVLNQKQPDSSQATEIASQPETTMQIDAQGNLVRISPEGAELAASQTSKVAWETSSVEAPKNIVGTATLDSGTKVSIYTTDFAEGEEKPFFDAPDKKVMAEITRADGSTETLAIRANTVISEDANGNLVVNSGPEKYKTSERFEINGTSKNDVIINLNGASTINCGEGNDTVFSFNMINNLNLEEGNNTFYNKYDLAIGKVIAGDGNNTFIGSNYSDFDIQNIEVGNGNNNFVSCDFLQLKAGNGNNQIVGSKNAQQILLGDGNNLIDVQSVQYITVGDGNNNITIKGTVERFAWLSFGHDVTVGNGDNTISVKYANNLNVGDGNNKIYGTFRNIAAGNGDNSVEGNDVGAPSEWKFGNGNNTIKLSKLTGGSFYLGDGANSFIAQEIIGESGRINTGKGDNKVELMGYVPGFIVNFGFGNNEFIVYGDISKLEYHGGNGDDTIEIKGNLIDSAIYTGSGYDRVTIYKNAYNSFLQSKSNISEITIKGELINSFINKP